MSAFIIAEYKKLKDEQLSRIGFRDSMLHVHLGLVGALSAWGISNRPEALLLVPWVSMVTCWEYLLNDDRISAIGNYIRGSFVLSVDAIGEVPSKQVLAWETEHRSDARRSERKVIQAFVDMVAFVLPSAIALSTFARSFEGRWDAPVWFMVGIGIALSLCTIALTLRYSDMSVGNAERRHSSPSR